MIHQCKLFVQDHLHDGISEIYGSGCTPLKFRKRFAITAGGTTVKREGTDSADWLAERYFLLASDGTRTTKFGEPRRLLDKTVWTHYQAWLDIRVDTRSLGHDAMLHRHFSYDRAIAAPLFRRQTQFFHASYLKDKGDLGDSVAADIQRSRRR